MPKVLFIDDDELMHRLYRPHIERAGYEVLSLLDGIEALEVAGREQPQVVVMDMMLPGMDGLAATLSIKANGTTKKIPVIGISSDTNFGNLRQQLTEMGIEIFLSKPFSPAKLVAEIKRLGCSELTTQGTGSDRGAVK